MTLAQQIGLETPNVDILTLQNHLFYVIERYDRMIETGVYTRLHQEDFCQILGIHPHHKYQNEGGPSIPQLFGVLRTFQQQGLMKGADSFRLMRLILFNFLIGNGDAHGKNFSVVYTNNGVKLAPCYDLLSTLVYGNWHKETMAMKITSKYKFKAIALHHFERMAEDIEIAPKFVRKEGRKIAQSMNKQSKTLLLSLEKKGYDISILKEIVAIIAKQSCLFL
jgi:serine/threonine-protein kinase HipA